MPSSGVTKPDILSDNLEDNYVWEVTQGLVRLFPSFIEGANSLNLGYAYDRMIQMYGIKNLERLDKRHISVDDYDTLNDQELNNRMDQMGVPYIKNDTSKIKKRRLRSWWEENFGGGIESSIKDTLWNFFGSGVFPSDVSAGTIGADTNRILIVNPATGGQWADHPNATYIDWADYTMSSGSGGTWGDYSTVGKSDLDIQIKFSNLGDWYYWGFQDKKADVYYLTEKLKPAGTIYTLSHIYDGTVLNNMQYWWKMDRDGSDFFAYENQLATNLTTHGDGLIHGSVITDTGEYLSGTLSGTGFTSGTDVSISFMFRVISDNGAWDKIVCMSGTEPNGYELRLFGNTTWDAGIIGEIGDGSAQTLHAKDFSSGTWHNVIITASSGTGDYITYVDNDVGTTVAGSFTRLHLVSGTEVVFGKNQDGGQPANVEIEEFMIHNRIITSTERAEIYEAFSRFNS